MSILRILAADTTTSSGSVAILEDRRLVGEITGESGTTHSARLLGAVDHLLRTEGLAITDIDAFAVAAGPGSFTAYLAADVVKDALLVVRTRRPGDRLKPLGLRGTIKVQDVLVDLKVPRAWRDRVPLVTCRDEVVWLPGYRIAWQAPVLRHFMIRMQPITE